MIGNVTLCSAGLIFDANMGICNWPSETNLCGFKFCPDGKTGYVSFEECNKFYHCNAGKIDGDIDPADNVKPTGAGAPTTRSTYGTVSGGAKGADVPAIPRGSTPTFQDNTARLRFTPTDDAYVQEKQPYQNYNDRFIVVDENLRYDGLLRFYVQGLDGRRINYVKLRLYVVNRSSFGGNFYKCRHTWYKDVVTWDAAPSILGARPVAVVSHAVLEDDWVEVDLTGLVRSNGPVSFCITSDSSDNVMYSSKEHPNGNSPELIIGAETPPRSSTAFAGLGAEPADGDANARVVESPPTVTNAVKIGLTDDAYVSCGTARNYGGMIASRWR